MSSDQENISGNDESENQESTLLDSSNVSEDILKNSDILARLQRVQREASLPPAVRKRVHALKNLQLQVTNLEVKFYEEVHLLECKYNKLYTPIHEKRHKIITGSYEPTSEESEWKLDDEMTDELSKELKEKIKFETVSEKSNEPNTPDSTTNVIGIPMFWLTALRNVTMINEMIQPCDEPILKYLIDIKTIMLTSDPMGFKLEFHFAPNEFFSNSVLTKEYELNCTPDPCEPFSFEGPEIVKCKGCKIDWKKGQNVTVKLVKKKQKHKNKGAVRTVTKTVQNDSFFNFFNPPEASEDSDSDCYEETDALLASDFEIGHYIRERVVPNAVLYYTGEAPDDEYDDDEEEEEEEEEEEGEDQDQDDESVSGEEASKNPNESKKRKGRSSNPSHNIVKEGKQQISSNPADCKQQ